jgi:6-phosphogluconolactonase
MTTYLYASALDDNRVRRFAIDANTGRLTHVGDTEVPDGPGPMGVHPSGTALYVGHRGGGFFNSPGGHGVPRPEFAISSWAIDQSSGELTRTGRVALEGEPATVFTDQRGRFVLTAHYQAGGCAVHPIDESGAVGGAAIEWRRTNPGAHSFRVDPTNRFAFLPHIADGSGGLLRLAAGPAKGLNAIRQFRFNEDTGELTPNDPPQVTPEDPIGPRHQCYHPTKSLIYICNEQGSVVTTYAIHPDRGVLTLLQTLTTLPEDHEGRNSTAQIHLTSDGRFLYCSNRGHDSIACFTIDQESGLLASNGWKPVGERPRAFGIDPSGRFLYATSQVAGTMMALAIDRETGQLSEIEQVEVGANPMWVSFAELP